MLHAEIIFDETGTVNNIQILECYDSYKEKVLEGDYIESLIRNQDALSDVDTVSGATITSTAMKQMLEETIKIYQGEKHEE